MSDLDPAIMDQFYMKDGVSASDVTHVSLDTGEILDATYRCLKHVSFTLQFCVKGLCRRGGGYRVGADVVMTV